MWSDDFPTSAPIDFQLAWVQEERLKHLMLLGSFLARDCGAEVDNCCRQLEQLEDQEIHIKRAVSEGAERW